MARLAIKATTLYHPFLCSTHLHQQNGWISLDLVGVTLKDQCKAGMDKRAMKGPLEFMAAKFPNQGWNSCNMLQLFLDMPACLVAQLKFIEVTFHTFLTTCAAERQIEPVQTVEQSKDTKALCATCNICPNMSWL